MHWTIVAAVCGLVVVPGVVFIWLMADPGARDKLRWALNAAQRGWLAGSSGARSAAESARAGGSNARERITYGLGHVYRVASSEFAEWRRVERDLHDQPKTASRYRRPASRHLPDRARTRFLERWSRAQAHFLDDPNAALVLADGIVRDVIRERGYGTDTLGNVLAAHGVSRSDSSGDSLEEQRRMMLRYRSLFEELLMEEALGVAETQARRTRQHR